MKSLPIRLTCPCCDHVERMSVTAPLRSWSLSKDGSLRVQTTLSQARMAAGATVCPNCDTPFGLRLIGNIEEMLTASTPDEIDSAFHSATVVTFPAATAEIAIDESLPVRIREAFVFIQEDAAKKRNPAGILSGARSCLDVALKALGENDGGRRVRINNLRDRGVITISIAEWAQTLWEEGSDAVHDLDANIDRAIEHVEFLKLFFEVAFGLPSRVAKASHGVVEGPTPPDAAS